MSTVLDYRSWQWNGKRENQVGINRRKRSEEAKEHEKEREKDSYAKQLYRQWELTNQGMCTYKEFLKLQGFTAEKIERLNNEINKKEIG